MSDEQYQVHRFARNLARRLAKLERANRKTARASGDLRHSAIDGGQGLTLKDADGNVAYRLGTDSNGVTAPEYVGGPVPAQPAAPFVDAGQRVVKVQLSGLDAGEDPAPSDFWRAEIHVSLDEDFEPSLSTLATYIDEPNGSATHSLPAGEWYVGVVWVTLSKQRSVMSELVVADIEPPVDAEEIEADLEDARQRIRDAREYADEQFDAFDVRVESAETDLNDAHDRIDAAEGALSSTQSDLDDAKADITAAQSAADKAIADALAAADLAEGKGQVISQKSAPTGSRARAENLWVRLPDMKVHYYDGDKWKPVLDPDTIAAAQQAADALTKANDLQTKHDALKLAVDGEGGLKDRLSTAENTLEDKAASSDLQELDDILRGTEDLPPQIADRFYAAMAIVEKLQAVSGWVGNVNLQDGAVTAEKIHATREMITKIMGAEWAYIAEQLVVDGDLIANNATLINAAMKNLSVSERASFVDAFAKELYAEEFTALVATMARAIIAAPNLIPEDHFDQWNAVFDRETKVLSKEGPGSETYSTTPKIMLEAGDEYIFTGAAYGSRAGTRFRIQIFNPDGSTLTNPINLSELPTEPLDIEHTFTATQTGGHYIRLYWNHPYGDPTSDDVQYLVKPRIERMLDGRLTVPGSIDVGSLNVTEEMVAAFARILHLVVDQIDVNKLWADTTWQTAGHFGSQDGNYQTRVDGTGVQSQKYDATNEALVTMLRLGAQFGLIFANEQGETTGSLSQEGDAALRDVAVESLTHGGRPLQDEDCQDYVHPSGNQSLITWRPRAVVGRGQRAMPQNNVTDFREHAFLEVAADLVTGRSYWITVTPFLVTNARSNVNYLYIRYTTDGTPPDTTSPILFYVRNIVAGSGGNIQHHGQWLHTAQTTSNHRFLVSAYTADGLTTVTYSQEEVQLIIEDAGATIPDGTVIRESYGNSLTGRPDVVGPIITQNTITTEWDATWYQNYRDNGTTKATTHNSKNNEGGYGAGGPTQGRRANNAPGNRWSSVFGFSGATRSGDPNEIGKTLMQALNGANIESAVIEFRSILAHHDINRTDYNLYGLPHSSPPNQYCAGMLE